MKVAIILVTLYASAFAFVEKTSLEHKSALKAFEEEIGAQPPLGFYDPLGLLNNADENRFNRLRYVELKHGRISMLAVSKSFETSLFCFVK